MSVVPYLLLIEDNPDDVFFFERCLKKVGLKVGLEVISTGDEALRFISQHSTGDPKPFLILLDLNLPHLNGLVLLQLLKSKGWLERVPVVAISGSKEDVMALESVSLGAALFKKKPLGADDVMELLKTYLPQPEGAAPPTDQASDPPR